MLERFAYPSRDLPRAFCRTDSDIFTGPHSAFTDGAGGLNGVQGDEIHRSLAGALRRASSTLCGPLANVGRAAANIPCRAGRPS